LNDLEPLIPGSPSCHRWLVYDARGCEHRRLLIHTRELALRSGF
jgi:hypothetical protein